MINKQTETISDEALVELKLQPRQVTNDVLLQEKENSKLKEVKGR